MIEWLVLEQHLDCGVERIAREVEIREADVVIPVLAAAAHAGLVHVDHPGAVRAEGDDIRAIAGVTIGAVDVERRVAEHTMEVGVAEIGNRPLIAPGLRNEHALDLEARPLCEQASGQADRQKRHGHSIEATPRRPSGQVPPRI